ncbi:MAG: hypothetical protein H0U12_09020 [Thermoleophilaceae bacterium]|nr:hypothetical protein [Thermoleophilaceae bacterium]
MSGRSAAWLAGGSVAAYVVLATVGLTLELRAPEVQLPGDEESLGALDVAFGVVLLVFTLVGALVASKRPSHPVGGSCSRSAC